MQASEARLARNTAPALATYYFSRRATGTNLISRNWARVECPLIIQTHQQAERELYWRFDRRGTLGLEREFARHRPPLGERQRVSYTYGGAARSRPVVVGVLWNARSGDRPPPPPPPLPPPPFAHGDQNPREPPLQRTDHLGRRECSPCGQSGGGVYICFRCMTTTHTYTSLQLLI